MKLLKKRSSTPPTADAPISWALTLLLLGIAPPACTVRHALEGHDADNRVAPVELAVGEERLALSQGIFPPGPERLLNLASEDPAVVDVFYHRDAPSAGRVFLLGMNPGTTRVHYGLLANQVAPFAGEESVRIGAPLPGIHSGSGVDFKDRLNWLRTHSLGSFEVTVR